MFELILAIIAITLVTSLIIFTLNLGKKAYQIEKNLNEKKASIQVDHFKETKTLVNENITIKEEPVQNINIYDFKNAENLFFYLVIVLFVFFIFSKISSIFTVTKSFINTFKTKRILKKLETLTEKDCLILTNLSELQILKNKHFLTLNKNHDSLSAYNDLLVAKHNHIIEKISN